MGTRSSHMAWLRATRAASSDTSSGPPSAPLSGPIPSSVGSSVTPSTVEPSTTHRRRPPPTVGEVVTDRMPALFVGHGNPMNALERNVYSEAWRTLGASLPRPRAILCISAHWYVRTTMVTAMAAPRTIHDFGG